jgi:hypothetical protein
MSPPSPLLSSSQLRLATFNLGLGFSRKLPDVLDRFWVRARSGAADFFFAPYTTIEHTHHPGHTALHPSSRTLSTRAYGIVAHRF